MAAVSAAQAGAGVVLLEKNQRPGRKMAIAGGGRCNFSNIADPVAMVKKVPGNGQFLYTAFHLFTGEDCRAFFKSLGIASVVEAGGKVFPAGGRAEDLVAALAGHLASLGVEARYNAEVKSLLIEHGRCTGVNTAGGEEFYGRVIVATGGLSYPHTGSTGKGYELAAGAGHRVQDPFPSGVALECLDTWITSGMVQGLTLKDIIIALYDGSQRLERARGDLLFTHFGISGPAVLQVSRAAAAFFLHADNKTKKIAALIDMFPDQKLEELAKDMEQAGGMEARKAIKTVLRSLSPERFVPVILYVSGVDGDKRCAGAGKKVWRKLAETMKEFPVTVNKTRPLREAIVTAGGVDVKEINPRTMESNLMKGLYFAGEVLDVDGYTGGFNMQIAFSTGYLAGRSAAGGTLY